MSQNLWQVVNMDDLLYFLRNGKNKIIVLTLVLLNTDESLKKNIRKFIKRKSEIYENITFLYYAVRETDFNRISIISGNKSEYPKMCHIYNVTELLMEINSIDSADVLESSFKKLNDYYINFNPNEEVADDIEPEPETENEATPNTNLKSQQSHTPQLNNKQVENEEIKNPAVEKKKFIEKMKLLKKKTDEYNIEFFRECQKRKKEEEKSGNVKEK